MVVMELQFIKGIGPKKRILLEQMGLRSTEDLLVHFPRRYEDRTRLLTLRELQDGQVSTCIAYVVSLSEQKPRSGLHILKAVIKDESDMAEAIWFNQPYLKAKLMPGVGYLMTGKARKQQGRLEILIQDMETYDKAEQSDNPGRILAVYPASAGLQQKLFRQAVAQILDTVGSLKEHYPASFLANYGLCCLEDAIDQIHRPKSWEALEAARERLIFDEFFFLQLSLATLRKKDFMEDGVAHIQNGALTTPWVDNLPFKLTGAQHRVIEEIRADMAKPHAMARLIQGDVGSGKTAVAAWALLLAVENGYQGAIMAPTEILARQHYDTLSEWFEPLGVNVAYFSGGISQKESRTLREALTSGEIRVAVGTHALIQEKMLYQRLGLVIIDEQHRFGVRQRASLQEKGNHPDMLIMSATPIPRSLALTLYGDLDISRLDEAPPGRSPVKTICILEKAREKLNRFIRQQLDKDHQAFVVCPLIEESEVMDLQNAEDIFHQLQNRLKPYRVGLLHGRMSGMEKEKIMNAFASGETKILVSTTVVEVGVNMPSATLMVIENSERFGLAQLHQLRGRVGRSHLQSYCVLVTNTGDPYALERLKLMTESSDGFLLAEKDLLLRGPGDLFGARQHGLPAFRLAKLPNDLQIMEKARQAAFALVEADPDLEQPEHCGLRRTIVEKMAEMVS